MDKQTLEEMIKNLPPDLRLEVERYVAFVVSTRANRGKQRPTFKWAGALKDMKSEFTSVALQHQISKWRIGGS